MSFLSTHRRLAVLLFFAIAALAGPASALAAHTVPGSAGDPGLAGDGPFRTPLVPLFRQCGTPGNPINGAHGPAPGVGSCVPAALAPGPGGPVSQVGPTSVGSVTIAKVPAGGGPAADDTIGVSLTDVQCGPVASPGCPGPGADYNPAPGPPPDLSFTARVRISDHRNCMPAGCAGPFGLAGTMVDVDLPSTPVDCAPTPPGAAPPGSTCTAATSLNALVPGYVVPGMEAVLDIFRVRIYNAGPDGGVGTADDQIFEHQGIYNP